MLLLIYTLLANLVLLVCFGLFPKYKVNNLSAIVVNYFVCFSMGSLVNGGIPIDQNVVSKSWFYYGLGLGVLFIIMFNLFAITLQKIGVMLSTIFQKMSLVIPIIVAMILFGESVTLIRWIGILLALASIILVSFPSGNFESDKLKKYWYLPILVFFGSGTIESILVYVDRQGIAPNGDIGFVSFLFLIAGIIGLFVIGFKHKMKIHRQDVIAGIVLGIPNFFTIYWLLLAISKGVPASIVFPFLNVGVILGSSIIGYFFFKESITKLKILGITLAIFSIYLIIM